MGKEKKFALFTFFGDEKTTGQTTEAVEIVPVGWVTADGKSCYWPDGVLSSKIGDLIATENPPKPEPTWFIYQGQIGKQYSNFFAFKILY